MQPRFRRRRRNDESQSHAPYLSVAYPHQWLTRDYGTFGPRRPEAQNGKRFTLAKGQSLDRRVGVLVHRGDVQAADVAQRYKQYVEGRL